MATVSNPANMEPELSKDKFFEDPEPVPYYSLQTVGKPQHPNIGSAALTEWEVLNFVLSFLNAFFEQF